MATEVEDGVNPREPGMGVALLVVAGMILMMAVLSALIWALMVGVAATTAGKGDAAKLPAKSESVIDQKALPAKP